jgi:hypothetical protein
MLDPRAMHELEKEALEDAFLAEAIEGYHTVKQSHTHMSLLQQQLQTRIARQQVEKTSVGVSANRMSLAALAGLILILSSILFWMIAFDGTHSGDPEFSQKLEAVEVSGSSAEPANGWEGYYTYIQNNINSDLAGRPGKVVLELTITGQKPENIKIIQGLSAYRNAEAVRLVKNGPAWDVSGEDPARIRISIPFR